MQSTKVVPMALSTDAWTHDPEMMREFVALATVEGLRPSSLDQGRGVLLRYSQFLKERFNLDLTTANWKEFAAYKAHLVQSGIARTTARGYVSYIITFYRLRAQAMQDPQLLEVFTKLKANRDAPQGEIRKMDPN